ncbi:AlpA family transcriptional regulator [Vibrio parahaemolyticus]|uniref:helix-turn-helix transcriptional regulator n=1 Tax=Vibrio parahaemolyticus TaxID=670 RepID=UPI00111DE91F|nr:AlpA family transcriptional regulator [Vibrio parahaemolyticus]EHH2531201.1 AlpA family transcriptional regulator [Vibrio parahaemolyticus]TON16596.1 AlpA family transcriptional regulator [Vibrio parahaemolyticus]HCG5906990.1 AlpA family transcriptional regulator [Vibrio parahaemolyticus]
MSNKIIRLPEVITRTGLSRSSIYLRMSKGDFPRSISLGERAVGWVEGDVDLWVEARISGSKALGGEND